ncbi:MAG TPA: GNAT family N-acetyltransferase [Steroidobacteraceae bacterium]
MDGKTQIEPGEMVHSKGNERDRAIKEGTPTEDSGSPNLTYSSSPGTEPGTLLTVEVVRSLAGVALLRADFAHLQIATGNTLPFALYEWQSAWCRHFLRQDHGIVDHPMFHVVRDNDGTCVAIVPLILTRRRLGVLNFASVGLLGADPAITEIRAALVQPGYEERVARALHLSLENGRDWDWMEWIGNDDRFSAAIGRLRSLGWQPIAPSYVLDLPPTWEEFRAGLKRNIRESLRRCYNSLKRDGHRFEFKLAQSPSAVQEALQRLFVLHALRANMKSTVEHADRFAGAALRQFVYDVCGDLAARGMVRVFQLEIAGQVVASRIGFVVGDSLYLYYSGFDPEWSKYSVMTTTVAEAIKYAIEQGLKTVNLSPGNDISKTRWGPREVPAQAAYEHSGRVRSRLLRHAYLKARSGEGLQGWLLRRLAGARRNWN